MSDVLKDLPTADDKKYTPAAYIALDVAAYRGRFPNETAAWNDKQLFDLVMSTDDDLEDDGWRALFASSNPNKTVTQEEAEDLSPESTHRTIIGSRGHVQAMAFARKGGAAFSGLLGSIATAKETERKGPIEVMLFFETHFDDEERASIPVPGSKKEEAGNKTYDKYTTTVDTKDGKKKVPGSWFTDVVKTTPEWEAIEERRGLIDGDGDAPHDVLAMRKTGEALMEKKRLSQRVSDMRTALVKGAMLWHHAEEVSAINPERIRVKMPFKKMYVIDADGNKIKMDDGTENFVTELRVTGNTIRLQDPAAEFEDKVYTVSEFLALKPGKLVGKTEDQTIVTLEATKARAPKSDKKKGKGKQEIAIPTSVEQLLNLFNVGATALDSETDQGAKLSAALMAAYSTPGEKGDDIVETVGDFALGVDAHWTVISARYYQIKAAKAAALNSKAQSERDKKKTA